jgi:hypothetical protein
VVFVKDVSGPRGDRILQLLDEIHVKDDEPGDASRDNGDSSQQK